MAACDLKIQLSELGKVYTDGEVIRGEVLVHVETPANCKGLEIVSSWSTHGRGNVHRGEVDSRVLFSGTWQPGDYRYPFELATAQWPPTYYGRLLNVSHQLQARAKLAWALDPKASVEFPVWATAAPEGLVPTQKKSASGIFTWLILGILVVLFSFMFLFLVPILLVLGAVIWFFSSYLPKMRMGNVKCQVQPVRVRGGNSIGCSMEFTPRLKTKINSAKARIVCEEVCVSGSGSNRTTHREELSSHVEQLLQPGELRPGKTESFHFDFRLPDNAPASLDLSDNDLNWFVEFRIDIPRWPDFVKKIPLIVEPSTTIASGVAMHAAADREPTWFDQVIEQLVESADDPQRLALVLDAIEGHEFEITLTVDGPSSQIAQDGGLYGGSWVDAIEEYHDLDVQLHIAEGTPVPGSGELWRGVVRIIGFDAENEQLIATALDRPDAQL